MVGMNEMGDALIDGHAPTAAEKDDGNNQTPQVELLTISEWMRLVSRFPTLTQTQQEQQFVAGIDRGVDPFGEHGRTAGDKCHDVLEYGHDEIGENRPVDRGRFLVYFSRQ